MYKSISAKYNSRQSGVLYIHICTSEILNYNVAGCVLRYCRLSAVKKSEAELRSN